MMRYTARTVLDQLNYRIAELETKMDVLFTRHDANLRMQTAAVARIIGKADPNFGLSASDPARKKESDELGKQVTKQIIAEAIVSAAGNPELQEALKQWLRRHDP